MQVADLLNEAVLRLSAVSESPSLDAQVLLANALGQPRPWILAHPEAQVEQGQEAAFRSGVKRLDEGEALPYVLGHWEFFGLDFILTPDVLIPRPETELIVERALDWLRAHPDRQRLADIGTGSGCIAVSLAHHIPNLKVIASDISSAALEVAATNSKNYHVSDRVQFIHADLLNFQPSAFNFQPVDALIANLPYIPSDRLQDLDVARKEPLTALDGGAEGLDLIRRLLQQAPPAMAQGGMLLLEVDTSHAAKAGELAQAAFHAARVQIIPDLAGHDRLIEIQLP